MLHAEGCILRLPGSPMDKCDCLNVQDEDLYLGIILNTKGTLSDFCEKLIDERLAMGLVPYASVTARDGL